jgi:hypothetical protein
MNHKLLINTGILLSFCSVLFVIGYYIRKKDIVNTGISAYNTEEPSSIKANQTVASSNTNAILSGNVFHPGRGKVGAKDNGSKTNAPAVPQKAGQFELTGIFQYQNTRGALIAVQQQHADPKKQKPRRMYKLGDSLGNGYNLVEISDTQVVIARGSERITLPLRKKQDNKK